MLLSWSVVCRISKLKIPPQNLKRALREFSETAPRLEGLRVKP
jgi:hypothetical protein